MPVLVVSAKTFHGNGLPTYHRECTGTATRNILPGWALPTLFFRLPHHNAEIGLELVEVLLAK